MDPNWTLEQKNLYRQTVAIIFANLAAAMPVAAAIAFSKERAAALINDAELFPPI